MTHNELIELIVRSLKEIRVSLVTSEYELQDIIKEQFNIYHIPYIKEYKIAPRKRLDFFVDGIAIEVKRGSKRPNRKAVLTQLERYSLLDEVKTIIYVGEKAVDLPKKINGKDCISIAITKNWGLSL